MCLSMLVAAYCFNCSSPLEVISNIPSGTSTRQQATLPHQCGNLAPTILAPGSATASSTVVTTNTRNCDAPPPPPLHACRPHTRSVTRARALHRPGPRESRPELAVQSTSIATNDSLPALVGVTAASHLCNAGHAAELNIAKRLPPPVEPFLDPVATRCSDDEKSGTHESADSEAPSLAAGEAPMREIDLFERPISLPGERIFRYATGVRRVPPTGALYYDLCRNSFRRLD